MNISLVSGWLPVIGQALALVALVVALDWRSGRRRSGLGRLGRRPGRWRRQLLIGVPIAAVVTVAVALVLELGSLVPEDFPPLAYLWGFVFVLSLWVLVTGWTDERWVRHVAAIVAVVLTAAATLGTVNARADSFPTLGRLFADDPEHVVDTPQLQQLRSEAAKSGHLPAQGVVIPETIPATVSHFDTRTAYVYLPPAWFAKVTPNLPTLVLLPGEPGSAADWSNDGDADETADAFASAHHGVAPIIVMPDPNGVKTVDSECVNSQFGKAETYLLKDVPAFARDRFNASRAPGSLAIAGLSAGGTCSIMLALTNPTVYPTFATFSGFASPQYQEDTEADTIDILFAGSREAFDAHDPSQLLMTNHYSGLAGWFEVGNQDTEPLQAAHSLQPAALKAGMATCILVRPGGHDFDLWTQALRDAFPWLSWRLGLIPEPASEPAQCKSP
ncbi:MAG: alpha/beta hydrolase-fold protein [Acidimicrobiales bacterium]